MTRRILRAFALVTVSSLALAGCKVDNRPLLARGEPAAYGPGAPGPGPLDPGYARISYLPPEEAYAYPERAYAMSRVFYERPPSYAFAYEDEQPWAWEAADRGLMFAEPLDEGWRYYYYEPGEDHPYFIQDPDYAYGFGDDGTLVALFSAAGALLGADAYDDYYPRAHDYWSRGYDLNQTYWRAPRRSIEQAVWLEQAPVLVAAHDRWFRAASAQPAWREAPVRHDNGRHLGWYKERGSQGREAAFAAPEVRQQERRAERREDRRPDHRADKPMRQARVEDVRGRPGGWGGDGGKARHDQDRGPKGAANHARGGDHGGGDRGKGGGEGHGKGGGDRHGGGGGDHGKGGGGGDHGKGGGGGKGGK